MKDILLTICPPVWHKLPPLGLAYISEYLKFRGYNVDILDLNVEDIDISPHQNKRFWCGDILDRINDYYCIGFSIFKSNQGNTLKLIKEIKKKNPKIKIILGGPQCFSWQFTRYPDEIKYIDSIIIGDALPPLDERPFPTFSGFRLERYERKRALPILVSRGCTRKCAFCSERLLVKIYSVRSPEKIIEEIKYHKKTHGTKWFTFHDSLINGDLRQLERLCDLLCGEDINWDAQAIIRKDMPGALLDKMKKSGCFNLFVGLESGSDKILKLMRKGFNIRDAEDFFKKCGKVGLHFEISLIVNFPGEGKEEFNETLNFIQRNREFIQKIAQVNPFVKYPGTMLKQTSIKEGRRKVDKVVKVAEELGIKYTPEFINNLI